MAEHPAETMGSDRAPDVSSATPDASFPLRLAVERGALGMELYRPQTLGPVAVVELAWSLDRLRFPLDLSGGVREFRHRRGVLRRAAIELGFAEAEDWLAGKLQTLLPAADRIGIWPCPGGLCVGLTAHEAALVFELVWAPSEADGCLIVDHPRGVGLEGPALGVALQVLRTVSTEGIELRGRRLLLRNLPGRIAKEILPPLGVRVPSMGSVAIASELECDVDAVVLRFSAERELGPPAARAIHLSEVARWTERADDALACGDLDEARQHYLAALEQAPKSPEIVFAIAEIDASAGFRGDSALELLAQVLPASQAGFVGAELLASVNELETASDAIQRAAAKEPYAPLAALAWNRAAAWEQRLARKLWAMDEAVACSPGLLAVRWNRLTLRLALGDLKGALADAEYLEAGTKGASARHRICYRAGRHFAEANQRRAAAQLFDRALRYAPDDPSACAALARAYHGVGKLERAAALMSRAVSLSETSGEPDAQALIDLATLMAESLDDLSQAIARAAQVSNESPLSVRARGLEARWRSRLGDMAGASLAYARAREWMERHQAHPEDVWVLLEAVEHELAQQEPFIAKRHAELALRLDSASLAVQEVWKRATAQANARHAASSRAGFQ